MAISRHGYHYEGSVSATSITFAYDCGSATNRVLVVTQGVPGNPATATYNGTNMVRKADSHYQLAYTLIWVLDDPSTGSNNVVVYGGVGWFIQAVVISYDGADTTGDTDGAYGVGANPTLTGLTTTIDGSYIVDHIQDNESTGIAAGGSQTELSNEVVTGVQNDGVSDLYKATAGQQNMSWTAAEDQYDYVAVEVTDDGVPASSIKTINNLAKASVKTINGLAIANVKTWNGLT